MQVVDSLKNSYVYSDLVVIKDKPEFLDSVFDTLSNPCLIIEVLSDSIAGYDREDKFKIYREIPTFSEYVLVSQDEVLIEAYHKKANSKWELSIANDLYEKLVFQSFDLEIPLTEIYEGVEMKS